LAGVSAIREEGLRIGKDISVIGYDGTPLLRMLRPTITTIAQDTEAMGRKAADMLLRLLRKEEIPQEERVQFCGGDLMKGETVGTPD
jgi:LacI family transcriptional regulator/LacI family purine nucleotide synthesis repressor